MITSPAEPLLGKAQCVASMRIRSMNGSDSYCAGSTGGMSAVLNPTVCAPR
jgi:hypothetical protein